MFYKQNKSNETIQGIKLIEKYTDTVYFMPVHDILIDIWFISDI